MGLISEKVEIQIGSYNIDYFEKLGYEIYREKNNRNKMTVPRGTKLLIYIKDLKRNSKLEVEVKCDICGEIKYIPYTLYNDKMELKGNEMDIYVCNKCMKSDKYKDMLVEYKTKNNLFKKSDKLYYRSKENRLKGLQSWINKHGHINLLINTEGSNLYANITRNNDTPIKLASELGYNVYDIMNKKPMGWYDDFSVVEDRIRGFINENGRFPSIEESGINSHAIKKYGGIYEIKRRMNYDDKKDLKDNSGFYNKSRYELWTANYLLANNITYKRESKPFKGQKYRTDFEITILKHEGSLKESIFVEVWGYSRSSKSEKRIINYNIKRNIKEELYKNNNNILISIEPECFIRQSFDEIQSNLYNIFKPYLNLKYGIVDNELIFPVELTDLELFEKVMEYSDNKEQMPKVRQFSLEHHDLYGEVIRRFKDFSTFSKIFGVELTRKRIGFWDDKNNIMEKFNYMIDTYGELIFAHRKEFLLVSKEDRNLEECILGIIAKYGYTNIRLEYYEYCLKNNRLIPKVEIKFINDVANKASYQKSATKIQQQLAKDILSKIIS